MDAAADAGADAVKFQTFKAEQVVTGAGAMAAYQKRNTGKEESQIAMLRALELRDSFYEPLMKRCQRTWHYVHLKRRTADSTAWTSLPDSK